MRGRGKAKETLQACLKNGDFMAGAIILLSVFLVAVFSEQIAHYGYTEQLVGGKFSPPSAEFWFGTDELGRDVFSRVVAGTRITLWVAFLGATLELVLGVTVGLVCGYFGRWVDRVFSFLTDLTWCIPGTILALAVVTLLGKGLTNSVIAISLVSWASYARPVRAKTMSLKNMAFVETGTAFGESSLPDVPLYPAQRGSVSHRHGIHEPPGHDPLHDDAVLPGAWVPGTLPGLGTGPLQRHYIYYAGSVAEYLSGHRAGVYRVGV